MNRIVNLFNKSEQRRLKNIVPDSITIDGQETQLERSEEMADRKAPHTAAILDGSPPQKSKVDLTLPKNHFNNVIRSIKKSSLDRVQSVRHQTHSTLKRLKLERDLTKAIKGIPKGSEQVDHGTLFTWMNKITSGDKKAIRQVIAIDATAVKRSE